MKKIIALTLVLLIGLMGLIGCKSNEEDNNQTTNGLDNVINNTQSEVITGISDGSHVCQYKYHLVKASSCLETGLFEMTCVLCESSQYVVIEKKAEHSFVWANDIDCYSNPIKKGVCSVCGVETEKANEHYYINDVCEHCGSLKTYPLEAGQVATGFTLEDLISVVSSKAKCDEDFETVFSLLSSSTVKSVWIDSGVLSAKFAYGAYNFITELDGVYTNFTTSKNYDKTIRSIEIKEVTSSKIYSLNVIFTDGLSIEAGYFEEEADADTLHIAIDKIAVNTDGKLIIFYKDGNYSVFGTVATSGVALDENFIVYEKDPFGLTVRRYLGTSKVVVIPETHMGLPVRSISKYAFSGTKVKEVTVSKNVEIIREYAFYNCTNLTDIHLKNAGMLTIRASAFLNSGVEKVFHYGSKGNINVTKSGNEAIINTIWVDMLSSGHVHPLVYKASRPSNCGNNGIKEHYFCEYCLKYFEDIEGKVEVLRSTLIVPATGNHIPGKDVPYELNGTWYHNVACVKCSKIIDASVMNPQP